MGEAGPLGAASASSRAAIDGENGMVGLIGQASFMQIWLPLTTRRMYFEALLWGVSRKTSVLLTSEATRVAEGAGYESLLCEILADPV